MGPRPGEVHVIASLVVETGPDALFGYVFRYGRLGWLVRPKLEVGAWQGKHDA